MIDIHDISGKVLFSTPINEGSKRRYTLMKEDYITLKFSLSTPISFWLGSYVDDPEIGLFEVTDMQKPKYNTRTSGYDYELKLDNHYWKWKNKIFKYTPEAPGNEATWDLTATLEVHLSIFLRNLSELGYKFRGTDYTFAIDSTVANEAKLISYSNTNMLDALTRMAETWNCEWWVEDNVIHFGRCEYGEAVELTIGKNVEDMPVQGSKNTYATRIYAFGSTRNLPKNYRPLAEQAVINGVVQKRLMLPETTPFVDSEPNLRQEEAVEQVVIFEHVYPRTNGTISTIKTYDGNVEDEDGNIITETFYRFKDAGFQFLKEYLLPDTELRMVFTSGKLNGMDFGVMFNPNDENEKLSDGSINPNSQLFEIVANEDYGRKLPGGYLIPDVGDGYILYGWDSTKIASLGLVANAEAELKAETDKYIKQTQIDPNTYTCKMMSDWVKKMGTTTDGKFLNPLTVGDRVKLCNDVYFKGGSRQSRIIGIEYYLDIPYDSPTYTVGETTAYSRIGELEKSIENLTYAGNTYVNGSSGSSVYIIGTGDTTTPTNRNVLSALRSIQQFLSKQAPDRTPFSLSVGDNLTAEKGAQFGTSFAEGLAGFGGKINQYGDGWLGGLHLRDFLEVPELRFNRVTVSIGNDWNAPGGGVIEEVIPDTDIDGNILRTGTIVLHLEDGEIGAVDIDDICQGIYHDGFNLSNNATKDDDDGIGNFHFAGFSTVYFRITDILETGNNSKFRYMLRPISDRWKESHHPSSQMHFVGYGNFTNKQRQTSRYSTRTYERYLKDVADWEFSDYNIGAQFGDLTNLNMYGLDMTGYSAYLNNIYMTGLIKQLDINPIRMEIDYDNDNFINYGETKTLTCHVFRGFEEITSEVTKWSVTRDSGIAQDDAAWLLKQKVKDFAGTIDICFNSSENDIGNNDNTISTLFTFVAEIPNATVTHQIII